MSYSVKVLLITGGDSSEREISLKSAKNVEEALRKNGHEIFVFDLRLGYEPIREISKNFDILFPVLHGEEGEGGKLHKFLAELGKPIVGTRNYKGLQEAWYKIPFKKYCNVHSIPTAPWKIIESEKDIIGFGFPCVLKASNGGSSHEVFVLKTPNELGNEECKQLFKNDKDLYVEEFIKGAEATVGILNEQALPIIEVIPPEDSWFSYENKYSAETQELPFAPSLSKELQLRIQNLTLKIHKDLNLGSYSRSDFIVAKDEFYILEINTIPGLTSSSLMPKMAEAAGMSFNEFIEELLNSTK